MIGPRPFACSPAELHPYECDGPGRCEHCDRRATAAHDPATCALCDPAYDGAPNEHRAEASPA